MINKYTLTYALYAGSITLLTLTASVQADSKRLQWAENKHFYQRFDQPTTWQSAQKQCQFSGGHLATITSSAERDFINNNLYRDRAVWIGASDTAVNGRFAWVTGEKWRYQILKTGIKNTKAVEYIWASPSEWGVNAGADMNVYLCEWSTNNYIAMASVPDINGNGVNEIAVLYIDYVTEVHTVKIRDPKIDKVISTLTFRSGTQVPYGLVVVNDINGNRVPEIGVMYSEMTDGTYDATYGQPSIELKDAKNNKANIKLLSFLNSRFRPNQVTVSPDVNRNGSSEITVLGIGKSTNVHKAETRDSKTGDLLNDTQF